MDRTGPGSSCLATILSVVVVTSGPQVAWGQVQQPARSTSGTIDFRISCTEQAQVEFNRGVALLHHMTYPRARESFEQVAKLDPRCAMAHWGIAMTLFQPLWPTRPGPAELQRGREAVRRP